MSDELWTEVGFEAECDKHVLIVMYYFLLHLHYKTTWYYMLKWIYKDINQLRAM
jgi:hypothetical protein